MSTATIVTDYGNGAHKLTFEGIEFILDAMGRISWMSDWSVIDGSTGWIARGLVREHCHGPATYNHVTLIWASEVEAGAWVARADLAVRRAVGATLDDLTGTDD